MNEPPPPQQDLSKARYVVELFLLGGLFDLTEDGRLLGSVDPRKAAIEVSYGKVILSCWSEDWSRSWRVLGCDAHGDGLRLECTKQMGRTACVLLLSRGTLPNEAAAKTRNEFATTLSRLIESRLQGLKVEHKSAGRLDQRHLRGVHARLVIKDRRATIAGIGVSERESQTAIDSTLAAGIIWLEELRGKSKRVNRLIVFAPRGRATTLATRLCALDPNGLTVSLFEVSEKRREIEPIAGFDQGDLIDRLRQVSHRSSHQALWPRERRIDPESQALVNRVKMLAPDSIEVHKRGASVLLSIRGLEFARVLLAGHRLEFGLGEKKTKLDSSNQHELVRLLDEIVERRTPESPHREDLFFRAQAERWLESMIVRSAPSVDATLDSRYVYSQVPAYRGEQRSFIDLLTATKSGRLAVIELKVSEDPDFAFQGLDYWLRVEWHRRRGDFERRGYFKGLKLADLPPLLYLVAPLFRFHATTKLISSRISKDVPVYRIGINENWRSGVKVLLAERLN